MSSSSGLRARCWCNTVDDRWINVVEPPRTTKTLDCGLDRWEPSKAMHAASQQGPKCSSSCSMAGPCCCSNPSQNETWAARMRWWMMIWDFQRPRKPVSPEPDPPRGDERIPHALSHPRRQNVSDFGGRDETLLRWRMVVVLGGRLWEPSVDRRGTYGREPPFCNAVGTLVISVRISVNMSDKVSIPLVNTRAIQKVQ